MKSDYAFFHKRFYWKMKPWLRLMHNSHSQKYWVVNIFKYDTFNQLLVRFYSRHLF
jgi:hypothetical protein